MQVSVENSEGLGRKLTVRLPAEQIQGAVDKRLKSIKGTVRLDGFRPGKVPFSVVKKRFGGQVRQEVLGEVIQSSFQEAVVSESLRPAGMPQILPLEDADLESGGFGYTATFEVFPEFELAPTNLIEIERPSAEVGEDDVDTMISNLRKQRATWSVVDREAVTGDQLIIDFTGTVEGEEFAGGSAENTVLELGSGTMIPGFEDQLIGVVAGGDKTIRVDFPDDYDNDELAGKPGEFAVHIHSVKQAELPELDNDFIKLLGVEQGGIEAFRKDIASNMKRELEQAIQNKVKHAIMEALSEANTVDIPNAMVSEEIGGMRKHMIEQMQIPEDGQAPELDDDLFRGEAERRVKLRLVVAEVIKVAELKASPQKVRETIEKLASSYQKPEQFVNYYYQNEELLQSVEMLVLEQAVTEWVVSQCKVTDKPATFQEVMNSASTV
jgi:trigger factor